LGDDPVNPILFFMKIIKTGFKLDNQKDQQAGRNANGQTQDIDQCKTFSALQASENRFKITFYHG
jgi:hypothetical protein